MITPDTKNWTWVLDRPCPECGFDTRPVRGTDVAGLIRANAAAWRPVLERADARERPAPDVWSPLEYGCHVRDVFRVFDERLRLMLAEDGPAFPDWDQDATAVAERYREQDPRRVADELAAAGEALAARFEAVAGEQWLRTGDRSDGSRFTVETLARYMIHDPVHHLHDVTR
ncbi:DinB family protein [Streptomyces sp. TRM 70361]|uniref:DinB family protein n=1 Tax=Streptomyces sp. TRM 70361 TaxID=3116553 RepID=UPI002E7B0860|nr:DinB family protein [Streptomyces sp. TRM 70361]MEE1942813.1 DinB family protein [Streptomyces sp. TRM 70361]